MAETLLPYMNAIWGYTGSAIEKNTRNGRFCFQKNEGKPFKPSSILVDASGNNRSEKPSEGGFLCILLHLIPESHDVSSKKPTVLELELRLISKKGCWRLPRHLSKVCSSAIDDIKQKTGDLGDFS